MFLPSASCRAARHATARSFRLALLQERCKDLRHALFLLLPFVAVPFLEQVIIGTSRNDVVMKLAVADKARDLARGRRRMDDVIASDDADRRVYRA